MRSTFIELTHLKLVITKKILAHDLDSDHNKEMDFIQFG